MGVLLLSCTLNAASRPGGKAGGVLAVQVKSELWFAACVRPLELPPAVLNNAFSALSVEAVCPTSKFAVSLSCLCSLVLVSSASFFLRFFFNLFFLPFSVCCYVECVLRVGGSINRVPVVSFGCLGYHRSQCCRHSLIVCRNGPAIQ